MTLSIANLLNLAAPTGGSSALVPSENSMLSGGNGAGTSATGLTLFENLLNQGVALQPNDNANIMALAANPATTSTLSAAIPASLMPSSVALAKMDNLDLPEQMVTEDGQILPQIAFAEGNSELIAEDWGGDWQDYQQMMNYLQQTTFFNPVQPVSLHFNAASSALTGEMLVSQGGTNEFMVAPVALETADISPTLLNNAALDEGQEITQDFDPWQLAISRFAKNNEKSSPDTAQDNEDGPSSRRHENVSGATLSSAKEVPAQDADMLTGAQWRQMYGALGLPQAGAGISANAPQLMLSGISAASESLPVDGIAEPPVRLNSLQENSSLTNMLLKHGGEAVLPEAVNGVEENFSSKMNQHVLEQVDVKLRAMMRRGESEMHIQLDPPELGHLSVKMQINKDGRVIAQIIAERPEVLEMLQRDSRTLERAFADSGLKTDSQSLSFSLRNGNEYAQQQAGANGQGYREAQFYHRSQQSFAEEGEELLQNISSAGKRYYLAPGGVDIEV